MPRAAESVFSADPNLLEVLEVNQAFHVETTRYNSAGG